MVYQNKANEEFEKVYNELLKSSKEKELEFVKNWKYLLYLFFVRGFEIGGKNE